MSALEKRKPTRGLTTSAGFQTTLTLRIRWQGQRESNPQPSVLETDALPIELYPYAMLNR